MDDKIKILVEAGLRIHLTDDTLRHLENLSLDEVKAFAQVCRKLTAPGSGKYLVYSDVFSPQPPIATS